MMFLLLVTLISIVLAVIMSVIAWRVARDERRRSDARVAALAAEIHDVEPGIDRFETGSPLFETASAGGAGPRFGAVVGIGLLVFGSLVAAAVVLGSRASADSVAGDRPAVSDASPATAERRAPLPLELVALGHERDGDRLTVRGVVRNPEAGSEVDGLTAVVFVFNRDGGFIASGRAAIESPALRAGGESTFAVIVPNAGDVGRYRVSFRTEDRVVPHVDRRDLGQEKS